MDELSGVVQLIELEGKLVAAFGKAILLASKGAVKGGKAISNIAKIKHMQRLLKVHYASIGTEQSMDMQSIEKLTGGNYQILNVPTEDQDLLISFFNDMKKREIPFAEMPDLEIGDGFTQIAVDPHDSKKIKAILEAYQEKFGEVGILTLEEYQNMSPEQLDELAKEGYNIEKHAEIVTNIKEKNANREYRPISINMDSLIIREENDRFLFRTPMAKPSKENGKRCYYKDCYVFYVNKKDMIFLDDGQTVYTHLKLDEEMEGFAYDIKNREVNESITLKGNFLYERFGEVEKDTRERAERASLKDESLFANFTVAKEDEVPDKIESPLPKKEDTMKQIVKTEKQKEQLLSGEYFEVTVDDFQKNLVAESNSTYTVKIPDPDNINNNTLLCVEFKKADVRIDDKNHRMTAQLKQDGKTKAYFFSGTGEQKREMRLDNSFVANNFARVKNTEKDISKSLSKAKIEVSKVVNKR